MDISIILKIIEEELDRYRDSVLDLRTIAQIKYNVKKAIEEKENEKT